MNIYDQLMSQGFYLGKSTEIFTLAELSQIYKSVELEIYESFVQEIDNDWFYFITCNWTDMDENKNKPTPYNKLEEKLDLVAKEKVYVQQSWWTKFYSALKKSVLTHQYVDSKQKEYVSKIYKINSISNLDSLMNVTFYRQNDFICVHQDGKSKNRICGLLIYLTPPDLYEPEYGGKLLLKPATELEENIKHEDYQMLEVEVEPTSPNMVILDFTKHNVYHAVEKCKTNFHRISLLTFFTLQ